MSSTEILRSMIPWAELFFRYITMLGSDLFYVIFIAICYWAVDKKASKEATYVLIISVVSNYWLKIFLHSPRPPPSNWLPGVQVSNYGPPSGHAQNSMTLWGWLAIKRRTWLMSAFSFALIFLIGLSRIYLGVHWLGDVLLGWAIGLIILVLVWRLEDSVRSILSRFNPNILYMSLAIFGLIALIFTEFMSPVKIVGLEDNFGAYGGLLIGLGIGLTLENKYVNFKVSPRNKTNRRLISRVSLGLIVTFGIMIILAPILPTDIYWLRAIRYALSVIIVLFIWPFIFQKMDI
jgi:hypothetical protein